MNIDQVKLGNMYFDELHTGWCLEVYFWRNYPEDKIFFRGKTREIVYLEAFKEIDNFFSKPPSFSGTLAPKGKLGGFDMAPLPNPTHTSTANNWYQKLWSWFRLHIWRHKLSKDSIEKI